MGGRGSGGGGTMLSQANGKWGNGTGFQNNDTLKEAIGTKGAPKSIGDAMVETNPYHSVDYKEFSQNCQRCVVAYEARRRGYNVTAQATYPGDTLNQVAYRDEKAGISRGRWMGAFRDAKPVNVSAASERGVLNNIEKQMSSYGNGARGVIQIFYKGGGGHVFNVEFNAGKVQYIEAQSGRIKDFGETLKHVRTERVALVRTDNLRFSERAKNFVTKTTRK